MHKIEDEKHFVLECIVNKAEREWFFGKVSQIYGEFTYLDAEHIFHFIMTNNDPRCLKWLGKFLHVSFLTRNQHARLENNLWIFQINPGTLLSGQVMVNSYTNSINKLNCWNVSYLTMMSFISNFAQSFRHLMAIYFDLSQLYPMIWTSFGELSLFISYDVWRIMRLVQCVYCYESLFWCIHSW